MSCIVCQAVERLDPRWREVFEVVMDDPDEVPVKLAASLLDGVTYVDVARHLDPPDGSGIHGA